MIEFPIDCGWEFPSPERWGHDDLVLIGADLEPSTILHAYSRGLFPMYIEPENERGLGWWSPRRRGVIPLDGLRVTRSLRQSMRRFTYTVDADFARVMHLCGTVHDGGDWITPTFENAYGELHRMGHAHSVEVWDEDGELVGGLYGLRINGLFAGESMFHLVRDASKAALVHLVGLMQLDGMRLLDTQWRTDHLGSLGCIEVPREEYLGLLAGAVTPR